MSSTYVSGSPVPTVGGNLYYAIWAQNQMPIPMDWDGWIDMIYLPGTPSADTITVVMREITNFLPGWQINRPDVWFPVPGSWPGGDYELRIYSGWYPEYLVWHTDAFDWVVEPNVLGMGRFAVGEIMTTKPYVSGAGYISRMSDYCETCAFDPKRNCPLTNLYWAFLARHEAHLGQNPRLRIPMAVLGRRGRSDRERDRMVFDRVRDVVLAGDVMTQGDLPR